MSAMCPRPSSVRATALGVLGLAGLLGAVLAAGAQPGQPKQADAEVFTGRLEAVENVLLQPRVSGYLTKVKFHAGALVKKGDLLFEIDPRIYKAALDQAQAELALAEARLKVAEANLLRAQKLLKTNALSREEYEKIRSDREEAKGAVPVARAKVPRAELDLDSTRITSPIDGRVGFPVVTEGNFVVGAPRPTPLANVRSVGRIYVYFDMDERTFLRLWRARQGKDNKLPLALGLADEKGFPHKGTLDGVDNRVDPNTGTIRMRGVFANPQGLLVPGMFARVRLTVGKPG
jgi:RND family efflux transporter MFP subunit